MFNKVSVFHDFSTDKSSFEIGVDNSSSLGSLPSITDSPAFDLILSSSEEMNKLKSFVSDGSDLRDHSGASFFNIVGSLVTVVGVRRSSSF